MKQPDQDRKVIRSAASASTRVLAVREPAVGASQQVRGKAKRAAVHVRSGGHQEDLTPWSFSAKMAEAQPSSPHSSGSKGSQPLHFDS